MTSTFGGLSIASSALAAQRAALTAAGHNIADANTPGFSRQQVHLAPRSSGLGGLHSGTGLGSGGVRVTAQQRVVDQFLIARSNVEQGHLGNQVALQDLLSRVERSF